MSLPPPGWYPNPDNLGTTRWWNGERWADYTAPQAGAVERYAQPQPPAAVVPPSTFQAPPPTFAQPPSVYAQPGPPAAQGMHGPPVPQPYNPYPPYATARGSNGYATAALVLGICGFVLMGIPLFVGIVLGGIPDVLAVIFGIVGIGRAGQQGGAGRAAAIWGLVLGGVSLLSVLVGAGWLW